ITGSVTGATGTVVDVLEQSGTVLGDVVIVVYSPTGGEFSDGDPASGPNQDDVRVVGGAEGKLLDGPIDEWANGVETANSDVKVITTRDVTPSTGEITSRFTTLTLDINTGVINDDNINANASIAQSKLAMQAADTRANSTGISQADLGLASFDSDIFTSVNGWITIGSNNISIDKIERATDGTVLGNYINDAGNSYVDQLTFDTIVREGFGLEDSDFTVAPLAPTDDPGLAMIRTGAGEYSVSNVTTIGETNSIVKTDDDGSIQVTSLILGGNPDYEVLSLTGTTVLFKTPAQGEILRSAGGNSSTTPTIEFAGILSTTTDTTTFTTPTDGPILTAVGGTAITPPTIEFAGIL
ncbi:MAG: hypothetical protein LC650_03630, partial [Actinobacteria bacterium]|nr:hypothetical protein [Actinomycetota bacterium]